MSDTTDKPFDPASLQVAWFALAHRLSVAGGSAVGLLSLFAHTRVHVACLRGFAAFVAVRVVAKLGFWALERALPDPADGEESTA